MFKKLVIGALTMGVLLSGGISANASELSVKEKNKGCSNKLSLNPLHQINCPFLCR
ncbi:hypothetical protein [Bacillus thuringiensis]|uniref:hypothetical protein n=1 Tax=Bacillus thuringiensis TaxID=1428 RepID=UPI00159BA409|nr:hypothetical protein [Bacillus thuringiensis]